MGGPKREATLPSPPGSQATNDCSGKEHTMKKMKKRLTALLAGAACVLCAVTICVALVGCGGSAAEPAGKGMTGSFKLTDDGLSYGDGDTNELVFKKGDDSLADKIEEDRKSMEEGESGVAHAR